MIQRKIVPVREHEKIYKDDDELTAEQAAAVLSENAGSPIVAVNVSKIIRRHGVEPRQISKKLNLYRYGDIKNITVSRSNAGRPLFADPAPRTLYIREYKRREREEKRISASDAAAE